MPANVRWDLIRRLKFKYVLYIFIHYVLKCALDFQIYHRPFLFHKMQINNNWQIAGVVSSMFRRQKSLKKKRIKLYSTLAHTALLYGSANWT